MTNHRFPCTCTTSTTVLCSPPYRSPLPPIPALAVGSTRERHAQHAQSTVQSLPPPIPPPPPHSATISATHVCPIQLTHGKNRSWRRAYIHTSEDNSSSNAIVHDLHAGDACMLTCMLSSLRTYEIYSLGQLLIQYNTDIALWLRLPGHF